MNLTTDLRPTNLGEYIGQEHIKTQLQKMGFPETYSNQCFLITGKSGIGKTTLAKIMGNMLDAEVISINGATQAKKDNIREIINMLSKRPVGKKCYLLNIEEAQGVQKQAMESLLNFIDEIPEYVFITMTTTEPDKILDTIKNRSCILSLYPVEDNVLYNHLMLINQRHKYKVENEIIKKIVKASEGSVREGLRLLSQYINLGSIETFGENDLEEILEECNNSIEMPKLRELLDRGFSAKHILTKLIYFTYENGNYSDCALLIEVIKDISIIKSSQEELLVPMLITKFLRR